MEMKNDVSFVLYDQLLLYEHQSTKNPNIPLRNLFYVSDVYSALTREDFLYGGIPVKIPEPKFVVFYNGVESMEEREVLKLSGLYQKTSEHAALELETVVLNINIGYNRELMERCKELHDYAEFVGRVRENLKSKNPLLHAVNEAVEYCIRNDILAEFLKKNRSKVIKMSIYEYDAEKVQRQFREQWKQMGLETSTPALGCAVAYPLGVVGVILAVLFIRKTLAHKEDLELKEKDDVNKPYIVAFQVHNPAIFNKSIKEIGGLNSYPKFVISRLWRECEYSYLGKDYKGR